MPPGRFTPVVALAIFLAPAHVRAQEPDYLRSMPSPDRVRQEIKSNDSFDTATRQFAVFDRLIWMMGVMQGGRLFTGPKTTSEEALRSAYRAAEDKVQADALAMFPPSGLNEARARFYRQATHYEYDKSFEQQWARSLFSDDFLATYAKAEAERDADAARGRAKMAGKSSTAVETAGEWAQLRATVPPRWRWLLNRATWLLFFGSLFALGLLRSLQPLRFHKGTPLRMSVAGKRYRIGHRSGIVTDIQRWTRHSTVRSSRTYTDLDGSTHTTIESQLVGTDHLQIMLEAPSGKAWDILFKDMHYTVAVGQHVTAVWAMRGRKKSGPYIILRNHEMDRVEYMGALNFMLWPARKSFFLLPLAVLFAGMPWSVILILMLVLGIAYLILTDILRRTWLRRFRRTDIWSLLPPEQASTTSIRSGSS